MFYHFTSRLSDDLVECLRAGVHDKCGEEAAHWLFNMKFLQLSPTLEKIGCDKGKDVQLGAAAIFGITFFILVTILLIVISGMACHHRVGMKASSSSSSPVRGARRKSTSASSQSNSRTYRDVDRSNSRQPLVSKNQTNSSSPVSSYNTHQVGKVEDTNAGSMTLQCGKNQVGKAEANSNGSQTET